MTVALPVPTTSPPSIDVHDFDYVITESDRVALERGYRFDPEKADRPVRFIETFCKLSVGEFAGEPFVLSRWQREILWRAFGWVDAEGFRRHREVFIEVPKKNGKALALDTLIPTPSGWTTMGEIQAGDQVFDEHGKPCRVVATTAYMHDRPCYRLTFSDGQEIVADAEHEWQVSSRDREGKIGILTTEELARRVRIESPGSEGSNHSIGVAGALDTDEVDLPVDPYTLGYWLGNGHSDDASICCAYKDADVVLGAIRSAGVPVKEYMNPKPNCGRFAMTAGHVGDPRDSIRAKLRKIGVLNDKHIPGMYLRASIAQRLELLRGLMDSDGFCSPKGDCEYTTVRPELRDGVIELIRSLGWKTGLTTGIAKIYEKEYGPKYRIRFTPFSDTRVFKLDRKFNRQKPRPTRKARSENRHIVSIEPVPSVPVRCIQVDSPSRLYLAGESMIPTHNSCLTSALALYMLVGDGEAVPKVSLAAVDKKQASDTWAEADRMIKRSPALSKRLRPSEYYKHIKCPSNGGILETHSSDVDSKDGGNLSCVIIDELHRWTGAKRKAWNVYSGSGAARRQPLKIVISTAGDDRQSVMYEQHNRALRVESGEIVDLGFCGVVYGPRPGEEFDPTSEETWFKYNPSLGHTMSLTGFRADFESARHSPESFQYWQRTRLNVWTQEAARYIDRDAWAACPKPRSEAEIFAAGDPWYAGLDLSSTRDITGFVRVAGDLKDGLDVYCRCWLPEDEAVRRQKEQGVPYLRWAEEGWITLTPGNRIDYETVQAAIEEDFGVTGFRVLNGDWYNANQVGQALLKKGVPFQVIRQGFLSQNAPTKELERLVATGKIRSDNPVLTWCISNCVAERDKTDNVMLSKAKSSEKIDLAQALVNAIAGAMDGETASESDIDEPPRIHWL